jgi:hypothetical protein
MKITRFREEARLAAKRLMIAEGNVEKTVEVLRRLFGTDEIEVSEWAIRKGKIYITFGSNIVIGGVIDHSVPLTALFPGCRIAGRLIEIETSELL